MANNRLYLVDTSTNEYLCLAKGNGSAWSVGNLDLYTEFMNERYNDGDDKTNLIIGTENDIEFYNKWIKNGENYNTDNKWE
jgi:hypothetical protein